MNPRRANAEGTASAVTGAESEPRLIRLRYPASCVVCDTELAPRTEAWWFSQAKQVVCAACTPARAPEAAPGARGGDQEAVEPQPEPTAPLVIDGDPGGSAAREYRRRKSKREDAIRSAHPKLGKLILAASNEPQSTVAWGKGAVGEQQLGARLSALASNRLVVLHDRRLPGGRANLDHLAVTPNGVYVIDSKRYSGRVENRNLGNVFRSDHRLYVGSRDCTKLVHGSEDQAEAVHDVLSPRGYGEVPVRPVLCFIDADWGMFASPIRFGKVLVAWPEFLYDVLRKDGDTDTEAIQAVARHLAEAFPAA